MLGIGLGAGLAVGMYDGAVGIGEIEGIPGVGFRDGILDIDGRMEGAGDGLGDKVGPALGYGPVGNMLGEGDGSGLSEGALVRCDESVGMTVDTPAVEGKLDEKVNGFLSFDILLVAVLKCILPELIFQLGFRAGMVKGSFG